MEIKRKWILIPTVVLAAALGVGMIAFMIIPSVWAAVVYMLLLATALGCMFYCGSKVRCPACGAPLYALNGRYLIQGERETYCAKCGVHIDIVK